MHVYSDITQSDSKTEKQRNSNREAVKVAMAYKSGGSLYPTHAISQVTESQKQKGQKQKWINQMPRYQNYQREMFIRPLGMCWKKRSKMRLFTPKHTEQKS